jgi:hypothetical protein
MRSATCSSTPTRIGACRHGASDPVDAVASNRPELAPAAGEREEPGCPYRTTAATWLSLLPRESTLAPAVGPEREEDSPGDVASEALDEVPAGAPHRETDVVADDGGEERENFRLRECWRCGAASRGRDSRSG